ncbi:MAG: four helix bundle protein [Verrucomicrobia bacterium]|nr:MAG: four helix bundle protein [Verrucomicrobiota bacterium]
MSFDDWLKAVPNEITGDSIWKMEAYRLSLFLADLAWHDATKLMRDRRTLDSAGQLYRAVGSIEANISEGYSRGSGKDRARFYEYALGSSRESRGWYYKGRHILSDVVAQHRIVLITHIARLLLKMVPEQRASGAFLHEDEVEYRTEIDSAPALSPDQLVELLQTVPMD